MSEKPREEMQQRDHALHACSRAFPRHAAMPSGQEWQVQDATGLAEGGQTLDIRLTILCQIPKSESSNGIEDLIGQERVFGLRNSAWLCLDKRRCMFQPEQKGAERRSAVAAPRIHT